MSCPSEATCEPTAGRLLRLGFVVMSHCYDYISLFVPCFDIPVSLGNLFQRIPSICDCSQLFRFNELFEED
jgi:hypothetical protein